MMNRRLRVLGLALASFIAMALSPPALAADPLTNDDLADATAVAALPFSDMVDLADATVEAFEPLPWWPGSFTHSVWYRYTPTENHYLQLDFDETVTLAIYSDGDYSNPYVGHVEFEPLRSTYDVLLDAHRTYDIQVVSEDPAPQVTVSLEDGGHAEAVFFDDRVEIATLPFFGPFAPFGRLEPSEPLPSCDPDVEGTLWYEFTAPRDMVLVASATFDHDGGKPVIVVYTGTILSDLTEVSCGSSEGASWFRQATTKFEARGGITYLFQAANANRLYLSEIIPEIIRLAGPDRIATAIEVSRASFDAGVSEAYLVTATDYPDALAAGAAAGGRSPVLLTYPDVVPGPVLAELARLRVDRVIIVGGSAVVSTGVESQLRSFGVEVERWSGPDRYATSVAVAQNAFADPVNEVWVASGENFPDAVTAGPGAAVGNRPGDPWFTVDRIGGPGPVLLVRTNSVPSVVADEITSLQPRRIVIVGGEAVITSKVAKKLGAVVPDAALIRLADVDRFGTAAAVADRWPTSTITLSVATGLDFPDALGGISAAAGYGQLGPILLVTRDTIPAPAHAALERLQPARIVVLGGEGVVSDAVAVQLESFLVGR